MEVRHPADESVVREKQDTVLFGSPGPFRCPGYFSRGITMFRKLLMTVLAVVAIGFGVGSTAEAGDLPGFIYYAPNNAAGKHKTRYITVANDCSDTSPVYVVWLPSDVLIYTLDLPQLLDRGARPVNPGQTTTLVLRSPGEGSIWAFDRAGGFSGNYGYLYYPWENGGNSWVHVTGPSTNPVVERY